MYNKFDENCKIIYNKRIQSNYFELKIKMIRAHRYCHPGQFFMISIPGVFLRRPFGVCRIDDKKGHVIFLYKVVGRGTEILSRITHGTIKLLGPLGKNYNIKIFNNGDTVDSRSGFNNIVVAGGTGISSVYFLVSKLKNNGILYYGARSKSDLLYLNNFSKLGWKTVLSTEDGSAGYKGYITDLLCKELNNKSVIFVCGPISMVKKTLCIAKSKNIDGFVSVEEKMACGCGNCQGCVINVNGQNKKVCKDGPVFRIKDIEL
ncbi:MAG: dihydroorotate dehydrogenase electron transfer subunit [Endomicrobium sp.]|jgi:dihydroorotate dehydrogenase electron transfer subunit|nr:dihydroorotate dehydrogenase electron transfer subunit [Endomicrobium sp.]